MIGKILSLLFGFLAPGQSAPVRVAGAFNGALVWGSLIVAGKWLLGPGREWHITLQGWEIFVPLLVGIIVGIVGHIMLHMQPPGTP